MRGQNIRKTILLIFFLLLPITLNYFSPVLVLAASFEGMLGGAFFTWLTMLISSLVFGRAWCAYVCPYGGLQLITDKCIGKKLLDMKWLRALKYVLGLIWLGFMGFLIISKKSYLKINYFYNAENIVSVDSMHTLIIYYFITGAIFILSLAIGKRAVCVYLCPMSILNIIGTKIKNAIKIPSLRLKVDKEKCKGCARCNSVCPVSLDVMNMVKTGRINDTECILCGECENICKSNAIWRTVKK